LGIQEILNLDYKRNIDVSFSNWIPASAGMTMVVGVTLISLYHFKGRGLG
jgi:hypothetical protein